MLTPELLALALAALAQATPVADPAEAPASSFGVDALLAPSRVESPAISPDGAPAAFTVVRAASGGEKLASALWRPGKSKVLAP